MLKMSASSPPTTKTVPPQPVAVSAYDEACQQMLTTTVGMFYSKIDIIVISALIGLHSRARQGISVDQQSAIRVSDVDLYATLLHAMPKHVMIQSIQIMRRDGLIMGELIRHQSDGTCELTAKGKKKRYQTKVADVMMLWFDYMRSINHIRFRFMEIMNTIRQRVADINVYFVCPSITCPNHNASTKLSMLDIMCGPTSTIKAFVDEGVPRCGICKTFIPATDKKEATALVQVSEAEHFDGTKMMVRLNTECGPLLKMVAHVDKLWIAMYREMQSKNAATSQSSDKAQWSMTKTEHKGSAVEVEVTINGSTDEAISRFDDADEISAKRQKDDASNDDNIEWCDEESTVQSSSSSHQSSKPLMPSMMIKGQRMSVDCITQNHIDDMTEHELAEYTNISSEYFD